MLRKTPAALALVAAWGLSPLPASARTQATATALSADAATPLPAITNTAKRTERRIDEVPATVTVQTARDIEAARARDIKDLFRNEVDLNVRAAPRRFSATQASTGRASNESLNIRGLEGNQVLLLVDGIRVPASFSFGSFAAGRADSLALDATQSVEVLRGPASTSFGSDGLAGAISLRTLEPADVLKPGRDTGGLVRLAAMQVDDSVALTAAAAMRTGDWQALRLISQREGQETRNQGDNEAPDSTRMAPNPLDYRQQVLLGKLHYRLSPAHRRGLTLEAVRRRAGADVISARSAVPPPPPPPPPAASVLGLQADDRVERERVSLEHRHDDLSGSWFQKAETRIDWQDAETRQLAAEDRSPAADRTRDNRYRERLVGLSTQFESSLTGSLPQRLSWGLDTSRNQVSALRDGTPTPSAPAPFGEAFPVRPFPDTDTTLAGGAVVKPSDDALTPRLGAVWPLKPAFAPCAQWAKGVRAPTPGQVNNGFTNVASGYQSIGNPDLRAETAESAEIGVRGSWNGLRWQVAACDNRYREFISQEVISGSFTPADPAIFQHVNPARARICGDEVRAEWRMTPAWTLTGASAMTRGTSERDGMEAPLDSVDPARTAVGLRWAAGSLALRADVLPAQAKARDRIRSATPEAFAPDSHTVLDLGRRWSDVRGLADTSPVKHAYTAPGQHL